MKSLSSRLLFMALSGLLLAAGRPNPKALEQFRWDQEPKKADWRYFMKATDQERQQLWDYHVKAGHSLGQWAWGWRLGWVRACGESKAEYCAALLRQALFDKALVVRAEAATRFGRRFDASKDGAVVSLLADAFRNPANARNGAPLFVEERILFALHQIGGEQAAKAGARLSAQFPATAAYWRKLGPTE